MSLKTSYSKLRPEVRLELAVLNSRLGALKPGRPHSLYLSLTRRCQLSCLHCRYRHAPYRSAKGKDMPASMVSRSLKEAAAAGIPRIVMFGGEPALYPGLSETVKKASRLGLFAEMDTNALLLDDQKLAKLAASGLSALRISLHAAAPSDHNRAQNTDSFYKVENAVKLALKRGFLVYLSSCLTCINAIGDEVEKLSDLGKRWGVHEIRFLGYVPPRKASRDIHKRISSCIRKSGLDKYAHSCFTGPGGGICSAQRGEMIFISPEGLIHSCPYALKVLGRIGETPLISYFPRTRERTGQDRKRLPCAAS